MSAQPTEPNTTEVAKPKKTFVAVSVLMANIGKRSMNPLFNDLEKILRHIGVYTFEEVWYGEFGNVVSIERVDSKTFLVDGKATTLTFSDNEITGEGISIRNHDGTSFGKPLVEIW